MNIHRVFIADDEPLFSSLLQQLVNECPHMELAGSAKSGSEALAFVNSTNTDLLVLDIKMPDKNGDEIIEELLEENPDLKIMMLSVELDSKLIRKTLSQGALGFVSKNVHVGELLVAMEKVLTGKQYLCSDTTMALITNKKHKGAVCHLGFELTEREKDVLDLLAEGFTSNEVADKLHLSVRTVETHRRNMLSKYGARNVPHLLGILYAQKD